MFVDNHRARRFYERYGFEAVGRYDFMVGTHADEDLIMRLKLTCERRGDPRRPGRRAARLSRPPRRRLGGVCAGLNVGLGSDDDRDAIAENRRRAVAAVAPGAAAGHRPPGPFADAL